MGQIHIQIFFIFTIHRYSDFCWDAESVKMLLSFGLDRWYNNSLEQGNVWVSSILLTKDPALRYIPDHMAAQCA